MYQRKDNKLVSVVIPAYNVSNYIEKCVESVRNQTYKNLEIILIDDGSTDSTPMILDKISKQDDRILVIHNSNRGVSATRNCGISKARGDYITFVDGDDFLAEDFVEYFTSIMDETAADFCVSENCITKQGDASGDYSYKSIDADKMVGLLLSPRIVVGCWNKMFKTSFIKNNNLFFVEKLSYGEGLNYICRCAQLSQKSVLTQYKGYYYRRNNESSATTAFNMRKIINGELSLKMIEDSIKFNTDYSRAMLQLHKSMYYSGACTRLRVNREYKKYKVEYKQWVKYIRSNWFYIVSNRYIPVYRKCLITGCCISPYLLGKMDLKRREKIVRESFE